jgi:muramidase (phage lysozyme)
MAPFSVSLPLRLPPQPPQDRLQRHPLALALTLLMLPLATHQTTSIRSLTSAATVGLEPPTLRHTLLRTSATLSAGESIAAPGPYRITPERRALLNTIRYAEGTWIGGSHEGYQVLYGGGRFADLSRHPEIVVQRRYVSAAAGAYQFLPDTWHEAARRLKLTDFRPDSQDQAALHLVQQRGALKAFDRQGLSAEVLARLAPEWASLPDQHGSSQYGQPVKSHGELQAFYRRELSRQRRLTSA